MTDTRHFIGLDDAQQEILARRYMAAREAVERFNELVVAVGGEGAAYLPDRGVVAVRAPSPEEDTDESDPEGALDGTHDTYEGGDRRAEAKPPQVGESDERREGCVR